MQFGFAYAPPLIIGAAVSSKIFDTLETGPKTVKDVSQTTGASERGLRAIMNALVGLDLLKKNRRGEYLLTPESEEFLTSNKPGSLVGFFGMAGTSCAGLAAPDRGGQNGRAAPGSKSGGDRPGILFCSRRKHHSDELSRCCRAR
jgi:hypothetical protein